jgi:hypothetical protein
MPEREGFHLKTGPDPGIRHRTQIGMFRPIRMDHTNCLQVVIKTLQFNSFCHETVAGGCQVDGPQGQIQEVSSLQDSS